MSRANDRDIVILQYNSEKNLNARQALHKGFSTNKYGWENWVFDQYMFNPIIKSSMFIKNISEKNV